MPRKGTDRRIGRTRQQLKDSLVSLIAEKGFEATTVQDIIDRANVGRSTFYAHFDGKEDLLVQGLDELREDMKRIQRQAPRAGTGIPGFAFASELFAHANDHRGAFRAMVGKRSGAVLQRSFHKMLTELMREELSAFLPRSDESRVPVEAVIHYLATGMYGLMAWWLDGSMRMSVDEIAALFRRLGIAAVRSVPARTERS